MIGLWIASGLMVALALAALLAPLLGRRDGSPSRAAYNLAVYKDQLAELERDRGRGVLNQDQAEAARLEIERRMLSVPDQPRDPPKAVRARFAAALVAVLVPGLAVSLYLILGSPDIPDAPYAARSAQVAALSAQSNRMESLTRQLADRLKDRPDDLEGWLLLGRSWRSLNRTDEAVKAFARAYALSNHRPDIAGDYGEALVQAADGIVTPPAAAAFRDSLKDSASAPRGRYYLALAQFQAGDLKKALQSWVDLEGDATPDAPWLSIVQERIADTAGRLGTDPRRLKTSSGRPRPAPAAKEAAPEGQQAMIQGMVDRLAARLKSQPDDVEGWTKLGRSYMVLGQVAKARDAYAEAARRKPGDLALKMSYAEAILTASGGDETRPPPDFVSVMREILVLDPQNPDALWYIGAAEAGAGHKDVALAMWNRLLGQLPDGAPGRAELVDRIRGLGERGR